MINLGIGEHWIAFLSDQLTQSSESSPLNYGYLRMLLLILSLFTSLVPFNNRIQLSSNDIHFSEMELHHIMLSVFETVNHILKATHDALFVALKRFENLTINLGNENIFNWLIYDKLKSKNISKLDPHFIKVLAIIYIHNAIKCYSISIIKRAATVYIPHISTQQLMTAIRYYNSISISSNNHESPQNYLKYCLIQFNLPNETIKFYSNRVNYLLNKHLSQILLYYSDKASVIVLSALIASRIIQKLNDAKWELLENELNLSVMDRINVERVVRYLFSLEGIYLNLNQVHFT
eukprot:NODE_87_length_21893_cov_0.496559.p8 type:complete len:292 gc:universal NODE_87_length_21893_cov_0.496559:13692-12817(-)